MEQQSQREQPDLFPIGTVTRLTGVSAMTLRNWEKRYGVPQPGRTSASGHRLYSGDDVTLVRHLAQRVAGGMPIRKAVAAARAIQQDPERLVVALLNAALALDATGVQQDLEDAVAALGYAAAWSRILVPVLRSLGDRWAAGGSAIAAEHLTSSAVAAWLRSLAGRTPAPGRAQVVLACGPGELHELGTLALVTFLSARGIPAVYLGADTPVSALSDLQHQMQPRVLGVTATVRDTANHAAAVLEQMAAAPSDTVLTYGGPGFDGYDAAHVRLADRARFLGASLEQAMGCIEQLCTQP